MRRWLRGEIGVGEVGRWLGVSVGYGAVIGVAAMVSLAAVDRLASAWLLSSVDVARATPQTSATAVSDALQAAGPLKPPSPPMTMVRQGAMIPTTDDWAEKLLDPAFWAKSKAQKSGGNTGGTSGSKAKFEQAKSNLGGPPASASSSKRKVVEADDSGEETFRTVCVRLCDGAFFPISFSTTREHFDTDAAKCKKTCAGGRLFYHRNPGAELDDLEDLDGKPYKKLTTAFLFRTTYNEQCKCRAHPWEEAARDQHRVYALEAQRDKGDRSATAELTTLTTKLKKAEVEAVAEKKRAEAAAERLRKQAAADAKAAKDGRRADAKATKPTTLKGNTEASETAAIETASSRSAPPTGLMSLGAVPEEPGSKSKRKQPQR